MTRMSPEQVRQYLAVKMLALTHELNQTAKLRQLALIMLKQAPHVDHLVTILQPSLLLHVAQALDATQNLKLETFMSSCADNKQQFVHFMMAKTDVM